MAIFRQPCGARRNGACARRSSARRLPTANEIHNQAGNNQDQCDVHTDEEQKSLIPPVVNVQAVSVRNDSEDRQDSTECDGGCRVDEPNAVSRNKERYGEERLHWTTNKCEIRLNANTDALVCRSRCCGRRPCRYSTRVSFLSKNARTHEQRQITLAGRE
jgi:hypothetical protein